jgi:2-hydroxy-3-oxopropionate reductase
MSAAAAQLTVGYIGLGLMGKSIARNILKAGFPLVVYNRSRGAIDELAAEGARPAVNAADVARQVDVLFTNLPDSPDVLDVLFGSGAAAEALKPGSVFVDNSTIKPAVAQEIAARLKAKGIHALDAPVSGGDIGARNGTLAIMVGGEAEAVERVRPVFMATGKTLTHVGAAGSGQITKCANQIMVAAQMVAMAELMVFAQKAGADPEKVIGAIKGGAAQCWTLDVKPPRIFAGNREPGFKASMQMKDLGIVMETAREVGAPLPTTAVNTQLYQSMVQTGLGGKDNSDVLSVIEKLAGTQVGPKVPPSA